MFRVGTPLAFAVGMVAAAVCSAQAVAPATSAEVVCLRHTLRWVTAAEFPNYFQVPEVRAAVFRDIEQDLKLRFGVTHVLCPAEVEYGIIVSFGPPNDEFPETTSPGDLTVGIFSFITRETTGPAISWRVKVVVKQHGEKVLEQKVEHGLQYFDAAGPPAARPWMAPREFARICNGLIMEALGLVAPSPGPVIVGSAEAGEGGVSAAAPSAGEVTAEAAGLGSPGYGLGLGVLVATGLGTMFSDLDGHPGFGFQVQGYLPLAHRIQLRPAFEWTGYRVSEYNVAARFLASLLGADYQETRVVFRTYRLGLDGLFYFRDRYVGPFVSAGVGVQFSRVYLEDRAVYGDGEEITPIAEGSSTTGLWLGGGAGYQWGIGNVELRLSRAPYNYTAQRPLETQLQALPFEERQGWALHLLLGLRF